MSVNVFCAFSPKPVDAGCRSMQGALKGHDGGGGGPKHVVLAWVPGRHGWGLCAIDGCVQDAAEGRDPVGHHQVCDSPEPGGRGARARPHAAHICWPSPATNTNTWHPILPFSAHRIWCHDVPIPGTGTLQPWTRCHIQPQPSYSPAQAAPSQPQTTDICIPAHQLAALQGAFPQFMRPIGASTPVYWPAAVSTPDLSMQLPTNSFMDLFGNCQPATPATPKISSPHPSDSTLNTPNKLYLLLL